MFRVTLPLSPSIGAALLLGALVAASPALAANTPPTVVTPNDTDAVPSTFSVVVDPGTYDYCDTDGCFQKVTEFVSVRADEMAAGSASVDTGGPATIEVTLEPGMHTLVASGQPFLGLSQSSTPVVVLVETSGGETDTDTDTDTDTVASESGDSETGGAPAVDEEGCACAVVDGAGGPWWALVGVSALVLRRRRR